MFSTQEYLISWGFYLLAAAGLMFVWWRMTAWVRIPLVRNVLRVSAFAALVMPYPVPEQEAFLAPALMMTFLEGLVFEEYGFSHAGVPLLLAILVANIIYLVVDLALLPLRRRKQDRSDSPVSDSESSESGRKTPTLSV